MTGGDLFTILRTAELLGFRPDAMRRLFARAPHLPLQLRRLYFLAGQSIGLEAFPPACRKAVSEKAAVSAWFDGLLTMDRLAKLSPAVVRAAAGIDRPPGLGNPACGL
jgi:hypothetical protein